MAGRLHSLLATVMLVFASISVALFYNITFFGKALIALPSFPVAGGCLFYYLSAFNSTPPVAQVLLWIVSFVLSGWLWWLVLLGVWGSRWGMPDRDFAMAWRRLQLLPALYLLPLPWLLWVHAQSEAGTSIAALRGAILVRDRLYWSSQGSETALNLLFLLLALAETVGTLLVLRRCGSLGWGKVIGLTTLAGFATMAALCALAEVGFRLH